MANFMKTIHLKKVIIQLDAIQLSSGGRNMASHHKQFVHNSWSSASHTGGIEAR